jgi:hypothetical protein
VQLEAGAPGLHRKWRATIGALRRIGPITRIDRTEDHFGESILAPQELPRSYACLSGATCLRVRDVGGFFPEVGARRSEIPARTA